MILRVLKSEAPALFGDFEIARPMGRNVDRLDTTKCEENPEKLLCNRFAFLTLDSRARENDRFEVRSSGIGRLFVGGRLAVRIGPQPSISNLRHRHQSPGRTALPRNPWPNQDVTSSSAQRVLRDDLGSPILCRVGRAGHHRRSRRGALYHRRSRAPSRRTSFPKTQPPDPTSCSTSPRGSTAPTARGHVPAICRVLRHPVTPPTALPSRSACTRAGRRRCCSSTAFPPPLHHRAYPGRRPNVAPFALREAVLRGSGKGVSRALPQPGGAGGAGEALLGTTGSRCSSRPGSRVSSSRSR
jgi:hypothetical protein